MKMKRNNTCENTCVAYFCEIVKECLFSVCIRSRTKKITNEFIYKTEIKSHVEIKFVVIKREKGEG